MNKQKILLADDSAAIRKVVESTLAEEGLDVTSVGDGDAAMSAFAGDEPDLVIADVHMPGMSALRICEMIKEDESTRMIPVILVSGSDEQFDPQEAHAAGADAFYTKPFGSIREVVDKVHDLLGERVFHEQPRAETDDIEGLYRQSFTGDLAPEPVEDTVTELSYAGMEDMTDAVDPDVQLAGEPDTEEIGPLLSEQVSDNGVPVSLPIVGFAFDDETIEVIHPDRDVPAMDPFASVVSVDAAEKAGSIDRRGPVVGNKEERPLAVADIGPDLMDELVRRVVEKLSDRVIREVAEETVPQITKTLLSEALEKDLKLEK